MVKDNAKPSDPSDFITTEIREHVESVAAKMVGTFALIESDFQDLCQEMYREIILCQPTYDPMRSSFYTFVCSVIRHWRAAFYARRIARNEDVPTVPYDPPTTDEDDDRRPTSGEIEASANNVEQALLISDVWTVINKLPPLHRDFCIAYMEEGSIRKACKKLGITSKHVVQDFIMPKLRKEFKANFF